MANLQAIAEGVAIALLGGAITWVFNTFIRLIRDVDAAFSKIRKLEEEIKKCQSK